MDISGSTALVVGGRNTGRVEGLDTVRIDAHRPGRHPRRPLVVTMSGVMLTEDLRDPGHITQAGTPSRSTCWASPGSPARSPRT